MVDFSNEFRRCLDELDVEGMQRIWAHQSPHLQQPDEAQTLATMHMARTQAESIAFLKRAYSHAWCLDHGLPSSLPDHLRPRAQQIYPVIAIGVGISVKARSPLMKKAAKEIQAAMQAAVMDAVADKRIDDAPFVKARIDEARAKTIDKLFG